MKIITLRMRYNKTKSKFTKYAIITQVKQKILIKINTIYRCSNYLFLAYDTKVI